MKNLTILLFTMLLGYTHASDHLNDDQEVPTTVITTTVTSPEDTSTNNFFPLLDLHNEIIWQICLTLGLADLNQMAQSCKTIQTAIQSDGFQRRYWVPDLVFDICLSWEAQRLDTAMKSCKTLKTVIEDEAFQNRFWTLEQLNSLLTSFPLSDDLHQEIFSMLSSSLRHIYFNDINALRKPENITWLTEEYQEFDPSIEMFIPTTIINNLGTRDPSKVFMSLCYLSTIANIEQKASINVYLMPYFNTLSPEEIRTVAQHAEELLVPTTMPNVTRGLILKAIKLLSCQEIIALSKHLQVMAQTTAISDIQRQSIAQKISQMTPKERAVYFSSGPQK